MIFYCGNYYVEFVEVGKRGDKWCGVNFFGDIKDVAVSISVFEYVYYVVVRGDDDIEFVFCLMKFCEYDWGENFIVYVYWLVFVCGVVFGVKCVYGVRGVVDDDFDFVVVVDVFYVCCDGNLRFDVFVLKFDVV